MDKNCNKITNKEKNMLCNHEKNNLKKQRQNAVLFCFCFSIYSVGYCIMKMHHCHNDWKPPYLDCVVQETVNDYIIHDY